MGVVCAELSSVGVKGGGRDAGGDVKGGWVWKTLEKKKGARVGVSEGRRDASVEGGKKTGEEGKGTKKSVRKKKKGR